MKIEQNIKVAVDAVVFGYTKGVIQILLIKQKYGKEQNKWALPGGFVQDEESLEEAVERELLEETGVKASYMEQLYTFGGVGRDKRMRVITVAYLALINPKQSNLKADTDAIDTQWFDMADVPSLAFDHAEIIDKGLERLRAKIKYQPIGFELLADTFPFSDLENLYQTILGQQIDRRNFRKKIMSFQILDDTNKMSDAKNGRPAKLFRFNKQKYNSLERSGFHFDIKIA